MKHGWKDRIERVIPAPLLRTYFFGYLRHAAIGESPGISTIEPGLCLLPALITEPGAALDIGANRGDYTYVIQHVVGSGDTYVIEPLPVMCKRLRRLFPKAKILNMALSDRPGVMEMKIPLVDGKPLRSRATLERFNEIGETGALYEKVSVNTLDALCDSLGICEIRYIKIDVEGHERQVFRGARKTLSRCHPILQIEIEQRHHREPIESMFAEVAEQGYAGFFFDQASNRLRALADLIVSRDQSIENLGRPEYVNNFLFFERSSAQMMVERVHHRINGVRQQASEMAYV
jgi:FkbM family methyltransferase